VIVEIDRAPVTSAEDAAKRFANDRSGGHLVRVQRGDTAIFLAIPPPRENE
jgi:hypothetical protein